MFNNSDLILVRYSELGLKARYTRRKFEDILVENIKNALKSKHIESRIKKERGRIYVYTDETEKSITILKKIFGIKSVSPALKTSSNISSISRYALQIAEKKLNTDQSFALRVRRSGSHEFSSQDVAIKVGEKIVNKTGSPVDLTNPDFELFIEVRDQNSFLFTEKIECTGGLPLGSQGKVLSLIEKTEDLLASWYLMRRGCKTIFLTKSSTLYQQIDAFNEDWFNHGGILVENTDKLYKIADEIINKQNCVALITGHSLKISSNVLPNLKNIKENVSSPVLHPLIALEKDSITKKCRKVGVLK
ncbi:MAG: THUMP domain-containing protein [Candidatus Thermoplasmatota archaeon]